MNYEKEDWRRAIVMKPDDFELADTACTREKEYTTLQPVPSKRLGMGPGGGKVRPLSALQE